MKRVLIFAHFDPHAIVDDHVLYTLRCYRQFFDLMILVSTSELGLDQRRQALSLCDCVIVRPNFGYDFLSWKTGLDHLASTSDFDEVVFANDSCYGPCSDFREFLLKAARVDADLWGASVNYQFGQHVQSYFMGFRKSLISSGFLRDFWSSVRRIDDKQQLIMSYEVGLSAAVQKAGFRVGGVIDFPTRSHDAMARVIADVYSDTDPERSRSAVTSVIDERLPNPVQSFALESLRNGLPFVKVELLRDNFPEVNVSRILETLNRERWYDTHLISKHLERVALCRRLPFDVEASNSGARHNSFRVGG